MLSRDIVEVECVSPMGPIVTRRVSWGWTAVRRLYSNRMLFSSTIAWSYCSCFRQCCVMVAKQESCEDSELLFIDSFLMAATLRILFFMIISRRNGGIGLPERIFMTSLCSGSGALLILLNGIASGSLAHTSLAIFLIFLLNLLRLT